MFRILIADRHAVTRAGYRCFLRGDPTIMSSGEAVDGEDTLRQLNAGHWDLLLLDVQFIVRYSLDLLQKIRAAQPAVRILVVSALTDSQWIQPLFRTGVSGYLPKSSTQTEFLHAVRSVLAGQRYFGRPLRASSSVAVPALEDVPIPQHGKLSLREFEILCFLAIGRRLSDTARQLHLSVRTVSTYRTRILEKMAFRSNADITHYALRNGLIPNERRPL